MAEHSLQVLNQKKKYHKMKQCEMGSDLKKRQHPLKPKNACFVCHVAYKPSFQVDNQGIHKGLLEDQILFAEKTMLRRNKDNQKLLDESN